MFLALLNGDDKKQHLAAVILHGASTNEQVDLESIKPVWDLNSEVIERHHLSYLLPELQHTGSDSMVCWHFQET